MEGPRSRDHRENRPRCRRGLRHFVRSQGQMPIRTMANRAIVPRTAKVVGLPGLNEPSGRGPMISQLEFSSRAALCRKLAKQEPTNRALWMAEAESWLRLSAERLGGGARGKRW